MIKKFDSFNENNEDDFITDEGSKVIEAIKQSFPNLMKYYSSHMGNFVFTKEALTKELSSVLGWMELGTKWSIIYEDGSFILTSELSYHDDISSRYKD
jgi:hypothetical protein